MIAKSSARMTKDGRPGAPPRVYRHAHAIVLLLLLLLGACLAPPPARAAPPPQAITIDAVDDDPANTLWNCATSSRASFGNEESDRARCFSFHYKIPSGGIKSATVHIVLQTLGGLQDTDATIVAVGAPYEPCAWGQGKMAGCVGLHGGFQGDHKSLNLNLLDIACDASANGTPEGQKLVLDQLQTGTLHMLLEDDTAVYSAQLILNAGTLSVCGTSNVETMPATLGSFETRNSGAAATAPPAAAPSSSPALAPAPASAAASATGTFAGLPLFRWNEIFTGTRIPRPPNAAGATAAAAITALLLIGLAAANYRWSNVSRARTSAQMDSGQQPARQAQASFGASSASGTAGYDLSSRSAVTGTVAGTAAGAPASTPAIPIESIPDARDAVADVAGDQIAAATKRRLVEEEKRRLEALVAAKEQAYRSAGEGLKRTIDHGGDFAGAQRAWQDTGAELLAARQKLEELLRAFPELTGK